MTPTLLDMAALFGFRSWGVNIDVLGHYEIRNSKTEIVRLRSYYGLMMTYQGMADRDQEHMMFLFFGGTNSFFPF